ncbi:MAG: sigma-70 family RNA polymerase sigma factor [Planctomycetota bacterium]
MDRDSLRPTLEAQFAALRALARRLVRDADLADDAVQDTCVAALRAAPPGGALRTWLRQVLRNAVRQRRRAEQRRRARELAARPAEPAPDGVELNSELALHRHLLQLVCELPDGLRAVVVLQFWRGTAQHEIASTLGIGRHQVAVRLEAALRELRRRLDAGGRGAWLPLLLAAARPEPVVAAVAAPLWPAVGWMLMQTKMLLAGGALLAVAAAVTLWSGAGSGSSAALRPDATPDTDGSAAVAAAPRPEPDAAAAGTARTEANAPTGPAAAPPTSAAAVHGAVVDVDGRRLPGVRVAFTSAGGDAGATATTDADGSFSLPLPTTPGDLATDDPRWATIRRFRLDGTAPLGAVTVLAAPARAYAGVVLDHTGAPVAAARVVARVPPGMLLHAVDGAALALLHDQRGVETDAQGRFAFGALGWIDGLHLVARSPQRGTGELLLPDHDRRDLIVRLAPPPTTPAVHGVVLDGHGRPVAGATVACGGGAVRTAEDGRFAAPWRDDRPPTRVSAARAGLGVASVDLLPGSGVDQPGSSPLVPVVLKFPPEPLVLRGRVVDADGRPVRGAVVWTPDLTWLGQVVHEVQGHEIHGDSSVEEQFAPGEMLALRTTTDADGAFALAGVLPRDYAVFALQPDTLAAEGPVAMRAGEPAELQLRDEPRRAVVGRVTAADGTPLAGVQVRAVRALAWNAPSRTPDPWAGAPTLRPRATGAQARGAVTDADGRFRLAPLVVDGVELRVTGDAVFQPPSFALTPDLPLDDLAIVAPAKAVFRVVLTTGEPADAFSLVRAEDPHVVMFVPAEGLWMSVAKVRFAQGISPDTTAQAGAYELVLWRQGTELRRQDVVLAPGGVHELRL